MAVSAERAREIFVGLGATDAEALAQAEAAQPAIAQHLFVRGLRRCLAQPGSWKKFARATDPVPAAIGRMLACGVDERDLFLVMRAMQADALYNAAQLLDEPSYGIEDLQAEIPERIGWRLVEWDGVDEGPGRPFVGTHAALDALSPDVDSDTLGP